MGVASLVLGIVSIVMGCFGSFGFIWVGPVVGIVGIALGAVGRSSAAPGKTGVATAGLACSIVGTVLSLLWLILCGGCALCASGTASSLMW